MNREATGGHNKTKGIDVSVSMHKQTQKHVHKKKMHDNEER